MLGKSKWVYPKCPEAIDWTSGPAGPLGCQGFSLPRRPSIAGTHSQTYFEEPDLLIRSVFRERRHEAGYVLGFGRSGSRLPTAVGLGDWRRSGFGLPVLLRRLRWHRYELRPGSGWHSGTGTRHSDYAGYRNPRLGWRSAANCSKPPRNRQQCKAALRGGFFWVVADLAHRFDTPADDTKAALNCFCRSVKEGGRNCKSRPRGRPFIMPRACLG